MGTLYRYAGSVSDTETNYYGEGTQTAVLVCLIRTDAEVAKVQSEEPGAGKLHAGICAGGALKRAFLPRCQMRMKQITISVVSVLLFLGLSGCTSAALSLQDVQNRKSRLSLLKTSDVNRRRQEHALAAEILNFVASNQVENKEALLAEAEKSVELLLWYQDDNFVPAIVLWAAIRCQKGEYQRAVAAYFQTCTHIAKQPRLDDIHRQAESHPPRLAVYRYLLGQELKKQAMLLPERKQKDDIVLLLVGKHEDGKRIPGALQHLVYAAFHHSVENTRRTAEKEYKDIMKYLTDRYDIRIELNKEEVTVANQ